MAAKKKSKFVAQKLDVLFKDDKRFKLKSALGKFGESVLPLLPPSPAYEPGGKPNGRQSFVMSREEEHQKFLEYNFAKREFNRSLKLEGRKRTMTCLKWRTRFEFLREYLCRLNLPLVYSQVARNLYRYPLLDWDEAVSEGQQALLRAMNGYDVNHGTKFSTYAVRIILNCLLSLHIKKNRKARKVQMVELPEAFGELLDADPAADGSAEDILLLTDCLRWNTANLTTQERVVLMHRFGLGNAAQETLEKVGDRLGVTKERVRQVQNKGLAKLKKFLTAHQ